MDDKEPDNYTLEELQAHQNKFGELWDADPSCWHEEPPNRGLDGGGAKCHKCGGWFCY